MQTAHRRERWQARGRALAAVRAFFSRRGFCEVDTPLAILANAPELHIEPVPLAVLGHDQAPAHGFLRSSPELAMKRLLAGGLERIYQLGHVFRDGEWTSAHRVEFMLLEWYRATSEDEHLRRDCEELLVEVSSAVRGRPALVLAGVEHPLRPPFRRFSVDELFAEHCGCRPSQLPDPAAFAQAAAQALGRQLPPMPWDDLFHLLWLERVAPHVERLAEPYFVERWPARLAALARLDPADERVALRTELYVGPVELANGFCELTDPVAQRARFEREEAERRRRGKRAQPLDEQFLADLGALPPAVGMALGFDRLLLLLTGAADLAEVEYLPPLGAA